MKPLTSCLFLIGIANCFADSAQNATSLQLTLPPTIDAVVGVETSIYFDNVVLTQSPELYRFNVKCDIGAIEKRRWSTMPAKADVGKHDLSIQVIDPKGETFASASTTLRVTASDAGANRDEAVRTDARAALHEPHVASDVQQYLVPLAL